MPLADLILGAGDGAGRTLDDAAILAVLHPRLGLAQEQARVRLLGQELVGAVLLQQLLLLVLLLLLLLLLEPLLRQDRLPCRGGRGVGGVVMMVRFVDLSDATIDIPLRCTYRRGVGLGVDVDALPLRLDGEHLHPGQLDRVARVAAVWG